MKSERRVEAIVTYYGKGVTPKYVNDSSIIVLNQKCIRNNKIDFSFAQFIDDSKEYNRDKYLQPGDILINSTGQGTAGRVAFVERIPENKRLIVDSHILVLRTNSFFESRCLNYSLFSIEELLQTFLDGSTGQGEFDKIRLFNVVVSFSKNPSTQQKIASVLSALDEKIELNNKINAELEAMAKTIYDYWFVQLDFPDKNGKPYKSSGGKLVYDETLKKEVPNGWEAGTLDSLGDIIGGSTPSKEVAENFSSHCTPWITPKDLSLNGKNKYISRGEFDVTEKGLKSASLKVMPAGTILLSSRAPIGYMAIARNPLTTNQGFKSFVPDKGYSTPFVFYTIKNALPEIISNASGSTFKEVSGTTLKAIKLCLPEKKVVEKYTETVNKVFERQNLLELENQKLSDLRDWLLPMLMNGQISVGEAYKQLSEALSLVAEE